MRNLTTNLWQRQPCLK